MSGFSPDWLALREPVDHRSRNPQLVRALQARFEGRSTVTVVDLGCGTGSNLRAVAPLLGSEQSWTLVDNDQEVIRARRADPRAAVEVRQADARALAFIPDGALDLVVALCVSDQIPDGESLAHELWRVLRPGGLFVEVNDQTLNLPGIIGDQIAYGIGRRSGEALLKREDSRWFKQSHLQAAHAFYEKHGGKTIILARFMPFARTFAPVVAGAAKMHYPTFVFYNVIGGLLWIWSMLLTGYYVVKMVPGLDQHVEKLIIGIILLSITPGIYGWWKSRRPR